MNFDWKCARCWIRRSLIKKKGELCHGKSHILLQLQAHLKIIWSNRIAEHLDFTDEETGGIRCERFELCKSTIEEAMPCIWLSDGPGDVVTGREM